MRFVQLLSAATAIACIAAGSPVNDRRGKGLLPRTIGQSSRPWLTYTPSGVSPTDTAQRTQQHRSTRPPSPLRLLQARKPVLGEREQPQEGQQEEERRQEERWQEEQRLATKP